MILMIAKDFRNRGIVILAKAGILPSAG